MNPMRYISFPTKTGLIAIAAIIGFISAASADEVWGFVKITCAPELGYFSIQRFSIMNLPPNGPYVTLEGRPRPDAVAVVEKRYGIYDSAGLKVRPFSCAISEMPSTIDAPVAGRVGFSVRVVGHLDTSSPIGSYAYIVDDAEVIFNGKSLAIMGLNPYGLVRGVDSIEIKRDGQGVVVRTCTLETERADKQVCETHPVD